MKSEGLSEFFSASRRFLLRLNYLIRSLSLPCGYGSRFLWPVSISHILSVDMTLSLNPDVVLGVEE